MKNCSDTLKQFGIKHEVRVISAHRTPKRLHKFLKEAEKNKMEIIIAAAGMYAHLAGVTASLTTWPVLGVPTESKLKGLDSLLSTVQMPAGIPVGTLAIGKAGAINAALLAVSILAIKNKKIAWLGDGNNIVYSLIEAAVQFDSELNIACPKVYEPNNNIINLAKKNKEKIYEKTKKYRDKNKEQQKKYYEKNKEKIAEQQKKSNEKNKEKIKE